MRDLLRRLDRLEQTAPPANGQVFLVGWEGEPTTAQRGGERIERQAGETAAAFKDRAVERFRPQHGAAMIWLGT